jgi:hypothetical protein
MGTARSSKAVIGSVAWTQSALTKNQKLYDAFLDPHMQWLSPCHFATPSEDDISRSEATREQSKKDVSWRAMRDSDLEQLGIGVKKLQRYSKLHHHIYANVQPRKHYSCLPGITWRTMNYDEILKKLRLIVQATGYRGSLLPHDYIVKYVTDAQKVYKGFTRTFAHPQQIPDWSDITDFSPGNPSPLLALTDAEKNVMSSNQNLRKNVAPQTLTEQPSTPPTPAISPPAQSVSHAQQRKPKPNLKGSSRKDSKKGGTKKRSVCNVGSIIDPNLHLSIKKQKLTPKYEATMALWNIRMQHAKYAHEVGQFTDEQMAELRHQWSEAAMQPFKRSVRGEEIDSDDGDTTD